MWLFSVHTKKAFDKILYIFLIKKQSLHHAGRKSTSLIPVLPKNIRNISILAGNNTQMPVLSGQDSGGCIKGRKKRMENKEKKDE